MGGIGYKDCVARRLAGYVKEADVMRPVITSGATVMDDINSMAFNLGFESDSWTQCLCIFLPEEE